MCFVTLSIHTTKSDVAAFLIYSANSIVFRSGLDVLNESVFFSMDTCGLSRLFEAGFVDCATTESCFVTMPRRWSANEMTESCLTSLPRRG